MSVPSMNGPLCQCGPLPGKLDWIHARKFIPNAACAGPACESKFRFCMLTISDVSKSFGGRTLFKDVALQVNRGDRIGLVGPNGAGKSTLFSLILQADTPDTGNINFQRGT